MIARFCLLSHKQVTRKLPASYPQVASLNVDAVHLPVILWICGSVVLPALMRVLLLFVDC